MDSSEENQYARPSQLRPPSRIPSPGKGGLSEITESQGNARSKPPSKMQPPTSVKHKLSAPYNEPEPKRKTLAERAGEPRSMIVPPAQTSRPVMKGTTLLNASNIGSSVSRNTSFSSSTSTRPSRTPSVSSRNTSHGSFSSSVGPGGRPASAYGHRPQTSFSQSTTSRTINKSRPKTSMDMHNEEDEPVSGRRMGRIPLPAVTYPSVTLSNRKLRGARSISQAGMGNTWELSPSSAMSKLKLREEVSPDHTRANQASSEAMKPLSTPSFSHEASASTSLRDLSINSCKNTVVLCEAIGDSLVAPKTPASSIPVLRKSKMKLDVANAALVTPCKTPKSPSKKNQFLSKDSNVTSFTAWDVDSRLGNVEAMFADLQQKVNSSGQERAGLEEAVGIYKLKIAQLEAIESQLKMSNQDLQGNLELMRQKSRAIEERLLSATTSLDDQLRAHRIEMDDARREYQNEITQLRREYADETDRVHRLHRDEVRELERRNSGELEDRLKDVERRYESKLDEERSRRLREVQELEARVASENQNLGMALQKKDFEIQSMRGELESLRGEVDRQQTLKVNTQASLSELRETLQKTGTQNASTIQSLESELSSLRAKIVFLESGSKAQSDSYAEMEARLQEAIRSAETSKQKLIKEETLRRILFNQVQELKGNIRVMCRVRPIFGNVEGEAAKLTYPDVDKESKELVVLGKEQKSNLGTVTRQTNPFTFDRVFGPEATNQEVFEEISQLVQSALDGYNVCIFCYGQTGAGKTHTMSSADGMIPRATHQIYETATSLQDKGWTYTMEGSFVEVYNEEIHDLLGSSKDFDKKKHEIRHDEQKKQTTVTGLKTVTLDSANAVESILKQADANRSVAATKSNERSSRSHSVFILKLVGRNSVTNETSEGTLNLVDLAGSERLKSSGAEGERMKETQNINKSLSCLGDVIGALGQNKEGGHIPYRNSKLTYLLQYSLGGNSKTLMFVMASPLEAHLQETITSLKFATKVHNTHIGTAKKSTRVH
ncbi:P-loop containing nucleoside triphosphate hydrolase protein [Bisporella sp. PMI_857]|nr:P-loop containing nucleoside triphosphate hydrolase protein [Bisporella sp. PMI_857]